jgi:hypothetical protein
MIGLCLSQEDVVRPSEHEINNCETPSCLAWERGPTLSQSAAAEGGTPQPPLPLDHLGQRLLQDLFADPLAFQTLDQRRHRVLLEPFVIRPESLPHIRSDQGLIAGKAP